MQIGLYYLDGSGNQVTVGTTTVLSTALPDVGYVTHLPDYQLTIPAVAASAPWAGQNIGVALIQTGGTADAGGYWDIDNVRLLAITPSVWGTSSGSWSTASNWASGGVPNLVAGGAVINPPTGSTLAIALDEPATLGALVLGNTGGASGSCVLSGAGSNMLTLNNSGGGATIALAGGSHEIEAPVVLADNLTVGGSGTLAFGQSSGITDNGSGYALTLNAPGGTLILSGSDSYGGGTTVTAGTLIATSSASLPAGSALTVGAGGVFIFDPAQTVAAPVAGAASASAVAAVPEPGTLALLAVGVAAASVACDRLKMLFVSASRLSAWRFRRRNPSAAVLGMLG
jgi:autotransporter-associated beta strand protein